MKALTIYQPWATLIALGVKPYEFRAWNYAERYHAIEGARIAIHASARTVKFREIADLIVRMEKAKGRDNGGTGLPDAALPVLIRMRDGMAGKDIGLLASPQAYADFVMPTSAIVCTVTLGKAVRADKLFGRGANDSDRDDHALYAWPMLAVRTAPAIPCRGAQGFWNLPVSIERDLGKAHR